MRNLDHFNVYSWVREDKALSKPIETGWVHKAKGDEVRSRLLAKDLKIASDRDDVFAATPTPIGLRILLAIAMAEKLDVSIGDFSVAFMHADISDENVFCRPPEPWRSRCPGWVWKMNKAMNGLRKAP
eukprot:9469342-Pyramimonas_sp.AAC.1